MVVQRIAVGEVVTIGAALEYPCVSCQRFVAVCAEDHTRIWVPHAGAITGEQCGAEESRNITDVRARIGLARAGKTQAWYSAT